MVEAVWVDFNEIGIWDRITRRYEQWCVVGMGWEQTDRVCVQCGRHPSHCWGRPLDDNEQVYYADKLSHIKHLKKRKGLCSHCGRRRNETIEDPFS